MSGRIKAVFGKQPFIEGASVEKQNIIYSYLRTVVKKYALKGHKRLQYATVWNNGVPTLYFKLTRKMQHYLVWFCMIISMFIRIIYINLMMFT